MHCSIVSMNVHVTSLEDSLERILDLAKKKDGAYVCVSNVHMCMETFESRSFREVVNKADLVIPDGRPLSWAQKLLGYPGAQQVRGQDILSALCEQSGKRKINIGLYGGSSSEVLDLVVGALSERYPNIRLTYYYSPPFRQLTSEEDSLVVSDIESANVDVLFVGLGCPKQERWMAEHRERLQCTMVGVGAAFDFVAGVKRHAPRWVQRIGLEWFFRLCCEPKRLWKRYLKQNPRFIYYFSQQWLLKKTYVGIEEIS